MYQVLNCLTTEHDWRLVALGGAICLLASAVAISLFHRARASPGRSRVIWIALDAVVSGCGIWATHFIAMLAYDPGTTHGIQYSRSPCCRWSLRLASRPSALASRCPNLHGSAVAHRRRGRRRRRRRDALHRHDGAGDSGPHRLVARHRPRFDPVRKRVRARWRLSSPARRESAGRMAAATVLLTVAIVSHHFTGDGRDHADSGSQPRRRRD